jgi:predicted phage terminase large subunit-like protein
MNAGAYTAGVKMCQTASGRWIVEDVRRGRWAAEKREAIMQDTARMDGYNTIIWVEQEPGSGGKESAQSSILGLAGYLVYAERPTGEKAIRADNYSVQVNNGGVKLLRAPWNRDFIDEHRFFPYSTYKDQVDAAAGAFNKLVGKKLARRLR